MPPKMLYRLKKVTIEQIGEPLKKTNEFHSSEAPGLLFNYKVVDMNFQTHHTWEFVIHKPEDLHNGIEIKPIKTPRGNSFPALERKSIMFEKATQKTFKGKVYCQTFASYISLKETNNKKRKMVQRKLLQRYNFEILPYWLRSQLNKAIDKSNVAFSKANDGHHPVIVLSPADHDSMIKLYFLLRVWPLREEFVFRTTIRKGASTLTYENGVLLPINSKFIFY